MPTRFRRVGVILDPELLTALDAVSASLRASSEAARVRELALIGAAALQQRDPAAAALADADRLLDVLGASKARGDLLEASARALAVTDSLPAQNAHGETPTESLAWIRGHDRGY